MKNTTKYLVISILTVFCLSCLPLSIAQTSFSYDAIIQTNTYYSIYLDELDDINANFTGESGTSTFYINENFTSPYIDTSFGVSVKSSLWIYLSGANLEADSEVIQIYQYFNHTAITGEHPILIEGADTPQDGEVWVCYNIIGTGAQEAQKLNGINAYNMTDLKIGIHKEEGNSQIAILNSTGLAAQISINDFDYLTEIQSPFSGYEPETGAGKYIISSYTEAETPTPTPAPTATPINSGNWIDTTYGNGNTGINWMNAVLPYFVPLILIMICGFLGYYFAGAWGFFAGLNLGVFLSYAIFPSTIGLWVIVGMIIVDALMLFGKVSLHKGDA